MFLTIADLEPFAEIAAAKAQAMIEDAEAQAVLIAPCLTDPALDAGKVAAVKSILRAAVLRWNEAGTGAVQTQASGPFSLTTQYQARRGMFWPTEISDLQSICKTSSTGKAFSVDVAPAAGNAGHADICALNFGGLYCSCGAVLTNNLYPLYEVD